MGDSLSWIILSCIITIIVFFLFLFFFLAPKKDFGSSKQSSLYTRQKNRKASCYLKMSFYSCGEIPKKKVSIKIHFKKYSWQKLKSKSGSQKNYKDILPLISCCLYITSCSQHSVWTDRHTLLENDRKNISFFGATLRNPIGKSSQFTTIVSIEH